MEAGRELDALLGEKLWDLTRVELPDIQEHYPHYLDVSDSGKQTIWVNDEGELYFCTTCGNMPALSTTGDGMLKVIEGMAGKGWKCDVHRFVTLPTGYKHCLATFTNPNLHWREGIANASADELPHAVAEAAAIALGAIKEG